MEAIYLLKNCQSCITLKCQRFSVRFRNEIVTLQNIFSPKASGTLRLHVGWLFSHCLSHSRLRMLVCALIYLLCCAFQSTFEKPISTFQFSHVAKKAAQYWVTPVLYVALSLCMQNALTKITLPQCDHSL